MFKIISAILMILILLCACAPEAVPVPEEPFLEESEEEIVTSAAEDEEETENIFEENLAKEIYESKDHAEYISLINKRIESYRDGSFVETPNHHHAYPEDFPDAEKLPEATEKNVLLGWRNTKKIDENSYLDGCVEYVYIIDENHAVTFEPVVLIMEGKENYAFASTGYISQNVKEWAENYFEGFFGGNFNSEKSEIERVMVEPELIAEHIAALNEAKREFFGARYIQNVYYDFYFEEENAEWNIAPDAVVPYGTEAPEGFYYDFFERTALEVKNFSTKDEVRKYMRQWLADEVFEQEGSNVDFNFMEFGGKLYLIRGSRGYGLISYGNSEITSKTAEKMTATAYIYQGEYYEIGTADIEFEKRGENWIIVSVVDNYY